MVSLAIRVIPNLSTDSLGKSLANAYSRDMTTTETITPISRDEFRQAVRRNIRSLLAMTDIEQQDLAPRVPMSPSQLSDRLTCSTAWRDEELLNVAKAFGTSYRAVVALTMEEFRQAINEAPPVIHGPTGSVQLDLFGLAA